MIKPIAFYLPQFHEIAENNQWWGKGFTEWTNVKSAIPLFRQHQQPKVPLDNNYYDLLDRKTMLWQAELAKKYCVYGFCMYHYWFKDGKKLLEKPAENLLQWKEIDIHYCFSWANESWIRTWSKRGGNDWNELYDKKLGKHEQMTNGMLMEQDYGDVSEWKKHFEYLLPFFKDSRYIKVTNRPMFLIYRPLSIDCLKEMLSWWEKWAVENGFDGMYILSTNADVEGNQYIQGVVKYEPTCVWQEVFGWQTYLQANIGKIRKKILGSCLKKYNYDKIWKGILKKYQFKKNTFPGALVNFDDTPRRGKNGAVFVNATPDKFYRYFSELLRQCRDFYKQEYVFLTAWNEWAEGAYLEPDNENQYAWLEAVREAVSEEKRF